MLLYDLLLLFGSVICWSNHWKQSCLGKRCHFWHI